MADVVLELTDRWRRPVTATVVIRRDTVEMHCGGQVVGVADRDLMRRWLKDPNGVLAYDRLAWMGLGHGGVALQVEDVVPAFVLRDHVVEDLRSRL